MTTLPIESTHGSGIESSLDAAFLYYDYVDYLSAITCVDSINFVNLQDDGDRIKPSGIIGEEDKSDTIHNFEIIFD